MWKKFIILFNKFRRNVQTFLKYFENIVKYFENFYKNFRNCIMNCKNFEQIVMNLLEFSIVRHFFKKNFENIQNH